MGHLDSIGAAVPGQIVEAKIAEGVAGMVASRLPLLFAADAELLDELRGQRMRFEQLLPPVA